MLSALSIRNVVLIEALDLDLEDGLTALTGETGAGKSIILDALGMATGARSDRGLIRAGAKEALCTAVFHVPLGHPAFEKLAEADIDIDPQEGLRLRRRVNTDGRSKAYINDVPVGVKLLSEIGSVLLEVHGQHDGRGLLDPSTHIHMLDNFGGYRDMLQAVASSFTARQDTARALAELIEKRDKAIEDRDYLTHAIAELDRLDPQAGEDRTLADRRKFLQGAEAALTELTAAQAAMGEDGGFEARLASALSGIDRVSAKIGDGTQAASRLKDAALALEKAMLETEEARGAVAHAAQAFDIDGRELTRVEDRLFSLRAASRKYDVDIAVLMGKRLEFATELDEIENVETRVKEAKLLRDEAQEVYAAASAKLSALRRKAARAIEKAVRAELPPLKMERAQFEAAVKEASPSAMGIDSIRFNVSTNPGTAIGPIDKIASGGEMARFALAIKVALAGRNDAVMVFDEVDQGVGGAVAHAVGKRLARLAQQAQVFVVTHSPQVAANAAHQFRIEKSSTGSTTTTHVSLVADDAREEEIARMLAGDSITHEARAAARQLMAS